MLEVMPTTERQSEFLCHRSEMSIGSVLRVYRGPGSRSEDPYALASDFIRSSADQNPARPRGGPSPGAFKSRIVG